MPCTSLGPAERGLLEVAGLLYDVGFAVSQSAHHKHSLYLIRNADLEGFTSRERDLVANIARYHRRALPADRHAEYMALDDDDRTTVRRLAALLRLADGLDADHFQVVEEATVVDQGDHVRLELRARDTDLDMWAAERNGDLFELEFGRSVETVATEVALTGARRRLLRSFPGSGSPKVHLVFVCAGLGLPSVGSDGRVPVRRGRPADLADRRAAGARPVPRPRPSHGAVLGADRRPLHRPRLPREDFTGQAEPPPRGRQDHQVVFRAPDVAPVPPRLTWLEFGRPPSCPDLDGRAREASMFLLETLVLERQCGPLRDAVTGRTDSQELEHIERTNLFLVAELKGKREPVLHLPAGVGHQLKEEQCATDLGRSGTRRGDACRCRAAVATATARVIGRRATRPPRHEAPSRQP